VAVTSGVTGIATGMTATKLAMTVMIGAAFETALGTEISCGNDRAVATTCSKGAAELNRCSLGKISSSKSEKALRHSSQGELAMSFGIYLVGYIIVIAGLSYGANLLHVPMQWIGVGVVCLVGIGIVHGVTATRQKDQQ
jgi:hypothetical protein